MPPIRTFGRTCQMPHEQRGDAQAQARHFSRSLRDAVIQATAGRDMALPQVESDFSTDLQLAGHVIEIRTFFGQNMAVKNGQKVKFFSYSVEMNLRNPGIEHTVWLAGMARWLGGSVGAGAGVLAWILSHLWIGYIPFEKYIFIAIVCGGASVGWKIGQVIQGMVELSVETLSKKAGGHDEAMAVWNQLTADADRILAGTANA